MAEFKLDGRMKVKTLKENFKKNFGSTLRVYKSITCKHVRKNILEASPPGPLNQKLLGLEPRYLCFNQLSK